MQHKQKKIFLKTEGDNYFDRNKASITDLSNLSHSFLKDYLKSGHSILEIGCGDARSYRILKEEKNIKYAGIDPSQKAISHAKSLYPQVDLRVGTADELPFENQSFDVIYLGFFLYVVDRELLPKIVYEVDRCLKEDGILVITDFFPSSPKEVSYKHDNEVKTFKYKYENMFLGFPQYHSLDRKVHSDVKSPEDRVATCVIHKSSAVYGEQKK